MNRQLSNGLPQLATSGNWIVNAATGVNLILRGVNRSGLEYADPDEQGFLSGAAISRSEIEVIVRNWKCNVVRVPFNQDFVLRGRNGFSGEAYQRALDQIIYWNSLYGAYTILDLQWLDADRIYGGKDNYVAPLPNVTSIELWKLLGNRYRGEPAVLYDLFNEPHDRLPDDPYPLNREDGGTYPAAQRQVTMREWQPWARTLTEAVRSEHPDAVVLISGTNWGYDLRGMPMDLSNVVYSTHVYSIKGSDWAGAFGNLSERVPVFAAELGGDDTNSEIDFIERLIKFLQDREIGWAAWSWFNKPLLINRYAATRYGRIIHESLTT
jgi:endoglucanase